MVTRQRVLVAAAGAAVVALIVVLALTSRTSGGPKRTAGRVVPTMAQAPTTTTSSTSTTAAATTVPAPPTVSGSATVPLLPPTPTLPDPNTQMRAAAAGYLVARENADAYYQATPTAWLDQAKPYLTAAGYAALAQSGAGGNAGFAFGRMHQSAWKIAATVACATDQAAATPTATTATLNCAVTDQTVDQSGQAVPAASIPNLWPYAGTQPPAILAMANVAGAWLVAADHTGQ